MGLAVAEDLCPHRGARRTDDASILLDVGEVGDRDTKLLGELAQREFLAEADSAQVTVSTLERAICLAAEAHAGQADKAGTPYILHALRVMMRMSTAEERIVAVLHDVVEDTPWTIEKLREEGFSEAVLKAVDSLTRRPEEDYDAFVQRAGRDPIARCVKRADLEDNCDLARLPNPTPRDHERIEKYRRALAILRELSGSEP